MSAGSHEQRRLTTAFIATAAAISLALVIAAGPTGARAATWSPDTSYGYNSASGFRNVLPSGTAGGFPGTINSLLATPQLPNRHFFDQQPLYENLIYSSPSLTDSDISLFYKDATFGVAPNEIESTVTPIAGVKIVRDSDFGVPKVYGKTRGDVMFGAGYAGATDRLFTMDVLRNTGRAQLSSFLGGDFVSSDISQWGFAPYSEADLRKQISQMPRLYGSAGRKAVADLNSYVRGINAYIADANAGRRGAFLPAEYNVIFAPGTKPKPWKATDVIATASLIGGIFGKGGGREVDAANTYNDLVADLGDAATAKAVYRDFRSKNDPEAPVTTDGSFPYQDGDPFATKGLAIPDSNSFQPTAALRQSMRNRDGQTAGESFGTGLRASLEKAHSSNWEMIPASRSTTGHPIGVLGPQVGYYMPQVLMEQELHGPGFDVAGAAFAGINLVVQLGHGRDYAWSATSAGSDIVDAFAEVLCGTNKYVWKGKCRKMEVISKTVRWKPNLLDDTPSGSKTLRSLRTVHGIVIGYGEVGGKRVAYVTARTTYGHEADSVVGFSKLNDPDFVTNADQFKKAAQDINFTFNWGYIDANDIAYYLSGAYPKRAEGVSTDFPVLGTGQYDWQGFNPATRTMKTIPPSQHPQTKNPDVLVSWNNKPAKDWAAADDQWGFGSLYRSQLIADPIDPDADSTISPAELVRAMAEAGTKDIRIVKLWPLLEEALGDVSGDATLQQAVNTLDAWYAAGGKRIDFNKDGTYEHESAVVLMDAWFGKLAEAVFDRRLGADGLEAIQRMIPYDDNNGSPSESRPHAPAFSDGWWGYIHKDLSTILGDNPAGAYSRTYCGAGTLATCRSDLRASLLAAINATDTPGEVAALYSDADTSAKPSCDATAKPPTVPAPECWDRNRMQVTSVAPNFNTSGRWGIHTSFPFQNRPTFQQVVTLTERLER